MVPALVAVRPADRAGTGGVEAGSGTAEFVRFFAEGWGIGAGDRFFEHFEPRIHPDALMTQPLARPTRGLAEFRATFEPLFRAIPDLRGEVRSSGETHEGALIELRLSGHLGGRPVAWTTIDRIVLEDGLIKERHAYFDPLPLALAMLMRPQISLRLLPTLFRRRRRT
jgi:ketosteroid isomerase-like protein